MKIVFRTIVTLLFSGVCGASLRRSDDVDDAPGMQRSVQGVNHPWQYGQHVSISAGHLAGNHGFIRRWDNTGHLLKGHDTAGELRVELEGNGEIKNVPESAVETLNDNDLRHEALPFEGGPQYQLQVFPLGPDGKVLTRDQMERMDWEKNLVASGTAPDQIGKIESGVLEMLSLAKQKYGGGGGGGIGGGSGTIVMEPKTKDSTSLLQRVEKKIGVSNAAVGHDAAHTDNDEFNPANAAIVMNFNGNTGNIVSIPRSGSIIAIGGGGDGRQRGNIVGNKNIVSGSSKRKSNIGRKDENLAQQLQEIRRLLPKYLEEHHLQGGNEK